MTRGLWPLGGKCQLGVSQSHSVFCVWILPRVSCWTADTTWLNANLTLRGGRIEKDCDQAAQVGAPEERESPRAQEAVGEVYVHSGLLTAWLRRFALWVSRPADPSARLDQTGHWEIHQSSGFLRSLIFLCWAPCRAFKMSSNVFRFVALFSCISSLLISRSLFSRSSLQDRTRPILNCLYPLFNIPPLLMVPIVLF